MPFLMLCLNYDILKKDITPGIIAVIQSFGSRINFHPHLHFLVTEGGTDKKGRFHRVPHFNDPLLFRFFTLEVFSLLLRKHLINKDLVQKILQWRHTGFNVYSKVRTESKEETERVGKYMIRPILSLKRLSPLIFRTKDRLWSDIMASMPTPTSMPPLR